MMFAHRHRLPVLVCAASALLAASASPASAQLMGRIKRAAQDKIASTVAKEPVTVGGTSSTTKLADSRLTITGARIELLLVAMQPVVAYAERRQASAAAERTYSTKSKEFDACRERMIKTGRSGPVLSMETQVRLGEMSADIVTLSLAQSQAAIRGDMVTATTLLDSMDVLAAKAQQLQYPALTACGVPARRPVPPNASKEPETAPLPLQPAGMSASQFGLLRERVAVYVLTDGREEVFNAEERAALDAHAAELAKLAPYFRDGTLEWAHWGKLAKAWNAG